MVNFITANRASTILYNFILSNDKVKGTWLIPTNVCHFVPATILKAGAKIEILDISEKDLCINQDQVTSRLMNNKKKYSGIIYVRSYGVDNNAADFFSKIKKIKSNLLLVDDKCLGIPSFDKKINLLVDLELFSTGYSKYIDLGYGGFAKLNSKCNYDKIRLKYSKKDEDTFSEYFKNIVYNNTKVDQQELVEIVNLNWLNSKEIINKKTYFTEVKAAIKKTKVNKAAINNVYKKALINDVNFKESSANWRYNILVNKRDEILKNLAAQGLFASKHYYPLSKIFEANETPIWNFIYNKILNLFNDFRYTINQAKKTTAIINKIENK